MPLTVRADPQHAAVLATLPESLRLGDFAEPDVVAIDGCPGWTDSVAEAVASGARGVMVIDPCPVPADSLPALEVPFVADTRWAWNQAAVASAADVEPLEGPEAFFDVRVITAVGSDIGTELLAVTALLRTATSGLVGLDVVRRSARGIDAVGRLTSGARANLSVVQSNAIGTSAWLRLITEDGSVELTVPDPATARPGRLHVVDTEADSLRRTEYESAHRTAWRRLHDLVRAGAAARDLEDLAYDLAIVAAAV